MWSALHEIGLRDTRISRLLFAVRAIPARVSRRGAFDSPTSVATNLDLPLFDSALRDRFQILDERPGEEVVIGLIGQFWKLGGGDDASFDGAGGFDAFAEPGFVKAAANVRVEATPTGTRVTTETRCHATDPATAKTFGRYWALIGWGSKLIRIDLLAAVARRTERGAP